MTAPVIDMEDRREPDRPPRRWRRWLVIVLVGALGAGLVWSVWFSSLLAIRQVRVVGNSGAGDDAVIAAAAVPLGLQLARLDADAVAARVGGVDWVQAVEVRRGWPSEVVLAVRPRVAVAVQADTGRLVDAQGVTFDLPGPDHRAGLPTIDAEGVALAEAVDVLTGLPADLARRVTQLTASTRDDVAMTLRSGALVRWGSADKADLKAQVLAALLARRARMYDVTAPELPTTFDERAKRTAQ